MRGFWSAAVPAPSPEGVNRTNSLQTDQTAIVPEPDERTRAAILRAVASTRATTAPSAWADAALAEGVSAAGDGVREAVSGAAADPLQHHDVYSLW
jgi:hypothetical protein